ncbi:MAG TPA: nitrous oxide reductase family maturation protein NosD [Azospira sp.]|nr:nitrous oxide reductase family maturation protein NosD [Azospira sp.]
MTPRRRCLQFLVLLLTAGSAAALPPLQPWIDATPAGGVLVPPPGIYAGPVRIDKPLTLDGRGQVTVDGGGKGTVLTLQASDSTIRGMRLINSGGSHDSMDGGMAVEGQRNRIEDNVVEDSLFGISLKQANDNTIRRNRIRSLPVDSADRGDALRLWYSMGNLIEANDIDQTRDITVANAPRNRFLNNTIRHSRRAMNFIFSHRSRVEGNLMEFNSTGVIVLNSEGVIIRNNRILHAMDASGAGIALKETAAVLLEDNQIIHCAVGIMADSPSHPLNRIVLHRNRLAHNITGINYIGERGGHIALNNRFENNLWQVTASNAGDPENDFWYGNVWDDYQGFDRNRDGVGDTPHEIYAYADRIWMATPEAKFFRSSPVLELLDFLERLAPFSHPTLVLRDRAPRMPR